MKDELKRFLAERRVGVIATCNKNKPRASTIVYYPDGLTLYFSTSQSSIKLNNIKTNSNVAIIVDDQDRGMCILQADGCAKVLSDEEKESISKKFPKLSGTGTVVRIDLIKIDYLDKTKSHDPITVEVQNVQRKSN